MSLEAMLAELASWRAPQVAKSISVLRDGHVLDRLRELRSDTIQCVVTSPPYYGLRNYQTEPVLWGMAGPVSLGWSRTPRSTCGTSP